MPAEAPNVDGAILSVRGEADLEVEPEVAQISVTVAARGPDRAKVLRQLNERAAAIDGVLAAFRPAIEKIETTSVHVSPQWKGHKPSDRVAGWMATVHRTVAVIDFSQLGDLLAQLADQDWAEIGGPWWELRPGSDAYREARIAAAKDALQRARDYAEALEGSLGALVEFADTGLLGDGRAYQVRTLSASVASAGGSAQEEFTFDITPSKQVVRASVEARFGLVPLSVGAQSAGP